MKEFTFWSWRKWSRDGKGGWGFQYFKDALLFSQRPQFDDSNYEIRQKMEDGHIVIFPKIKIKSLLRKI